ncbi:hypothetical protein JXD20_00910 [Candidatus Peregrinibacteria bacterium]|nr:hypothetical protein [Candidatus Peregrinibacteria bacterium]
MKKTILFLLLFTLLVPGVQAATLVSDYETVADKYELQEFAPILITSTSDGDITAEHGIRIMLAPDEKILWDDTQPAITGTAKNNGKVDLNVRVEFSDDYKSVFIPVKEDFEATEWLNLVKLYVRAYDERFDPEKLGMDLNGDMAADVLDINQYSVGRDVRTDGVKPYPVRNLTHEINDDGSVTFNWDKPVDYDYEKTVIDRDRIKNGFSQLATVYKDYATTFTDDDLDGVTSATYFIIAKDQAGNGSKPVEVFIDFTVPTEEPAEEPAEPEEPAEEPTEPVDVSEDEVAEMTRLLNYYKVRYQIKCMPSGVAVPENNSACLWARIDLIYASDVSGTPRLPGLTLTDRDLELMASRRQWPEMRYEDNCISAAEPANYCPALGKALDRISYFLD